MPLSDLKIKLSIFGKHFDNGYDYFFPGNHPGDFNGPLSGNRAQKWARRVERKDMWQALILSAFMTPVGWTIIIEDSQNFLGWLAFIGGLVALTFLFRKGIENTEHREKIEKEHKERITYLEKEHGKRITELEKQIAELQRKLEK